MATPSTHPFNCSRCANHNVSEFAIYEPTDNWLIVYPKIRLIHAHLGIATWDDRSSTEEAAWIQATLEKIYTQHSPTTFLIFVDLTRSDDSEFPSRKALKIYAEIFKHTQTASMVLYGVSTAMQGIIQIVLHLSGAHKKVQVVKNIHQADTCFREWSKKNKTRAV
ncbi:MAG: hypothetical protein HYV32_01445 [Candidatus Kerfeldbacteria bacterium]|nr:hypothetical protein [Candidatus Kerfeldbacteria bacterium]